MADRGYELLPQGSDQPVQADGLATQEPAWRRRDKRKRWGFIGGAIVLLLLVFAIVRGLQADSDVGEIGGKPDRVGTDGLPSLPQYPWLNPSNSLKFNHSTVLARENLRNDTYYVTSFAQAGFTNEFIAYDQLIYLGYRSGRVPIIPPIIPAAHVSKSAGIISFGSIFNLTILRTALRFPVLEWSDVKTLPHNASVLDELKSDDPTVEHFGCWSTRERTSNNPSSTPPSENLLRLDLSFTRVPTFAFFDEKNEKENWTTFFGLSATILPGGHAHKDADPERLQLMRKSRLGSELKPEDQLACFDFLYYVTSGTKAFEFESKWSPAWFTVGRHLRFTESLKELSKGYLRRAFNLPNGQEVPPIITVHIRHGDFDINCKEGDKPPCHLPLLAYKEGVEKVQGEVLAKHGVDIQHVLVASDENDSKFYDELRSYGWSYLNHTAEVTFEKYGEWYPLLIDKVALSMGLGFVGTQHSTFSVLNAARVEDWNGGVTTMMDYFSWNPKALS